MKPYATGDCPRCGRSVGITWDRFKQHNLHRYQSGELCPMSEQPVPVKGFGPETYERRARLITHLAQQVQEYDPRSAFDYLTCLPADELQRLLIVAFAALPLDRSVEELWEWIYDLPIAQESA